MIKNKKLFLAYGLFLSLFLGVLFFYQTIAIPGSFVTPQKQLAYFKENQKLRSTAEYLGIHLTLAKEATSPAKCNKNAQELLGLAKSLASKDLPYDEDIKRFVDLSTRDLFLQNSIVVTATIIERLITHYAAAIQSLMPYVDDEDSVNALRAIHRKLTSWEFTLQAAADAPVQYITKEQHDLVMHFFAKTKDKKNQTLFHFEKTEAAQNTTFNTLFGFQVKLQQDVALLSKTRTDVFNTMGQLKTLLIEKIEENTQQAFKELEAGNASILSIAQGTFFFALFFCLVTLYIIYRFITAPIQETTQVLHAIKQGTYDNSVMSPAFSLVELKEMHDFLQTYSEPLTHLYNNEAMVIPNEQERKIIEEELNAITTASSDGYYIWDKDKIYTASASLLYMLEVESEEQMILQRTLLRLPSPSVTPALFATTLSLGSLRKNHEFSTLAGTSIPCELVHVHLKVGGDKILTYVRDMRVHKKLTDSLAEARIQAEFANDLKNDFLAKANQQLRPLLNNALGFSHVALSHNPPAEFKTYFTKIQSFIFKLLQQLEYILDVPVKDKKKLSVEPFFIHALVHALHEELKPLAQNKGLTFDLELDPAVPATLSADSKRIEQILRALCENAIHFTEKGTVLLKFHLIRQTSDNNVITFEVHDTGLGISPEQMEKLFEPVFQKDASLTGINLFLVKNFLESMQSQLGVKSTVGKGSCFSFTLNLPRIQTVQKELFATLDLGLHKEVADKHMKTVLLVEDNELNQEVVMAILENMGIASIVASNGSEAIEILKHTTVDAILMDIQMPVMDGLTATKEIRLHGREEIRNIPILALTALGTTNDKMSTQASGMNGHLTKPIDIELFQHELNKWLEPTISENPK